MKLHGIALGKLLSMFFCVQCMEQAKQPLLNKVNDVCNNAVLMLEKDNNKKYSSGRICMKRTKFVDIDNKYYKDWQNFTGTETRK